jgi:ppGpp synthetase/RelA/SpoT-type nucleotidyltranferase
MTSAELDEIVKVVQDELPRFHWFLDSVESSFRTEPKLHESPSVIHSIKRRIKDVDHLREKIDRKSTDEDPVTPGNVFTKITDIAGVRILHLHQRQFTKIHEHITRQVTRGDWACHEPPIALTWDPESREFFEGHNLAVEVRSSFYTSIHYVLKPRLDSPLTCEVQVRTLFEEIWGEIDHTINYPTKTTNVACAEQLRVLARFVAAGSRLADSIFKTHAL